MSRRSAVAAVINSIGNVPLVGPKGRVFAIEPMPENVASVREQIEVNGLANVEVIEAAAGAEAGMATLYVPRGNNSMAHLGEARGAEASLQVKIVTLDDFAREHPGPSALKIDVEGAEDSVLAGATAVTVYRNWQARRRGRNRDDLTRMIQ